MMIVRFLLKIVIFPVILSFMPSMQAQEVAIRICRIC